MNQTAFASTWRAQSIGAACLILFSALVAVAVEPIIITSVSKQFVVRGLPQRSMFAATAKEDFAYLDPATLAVTCERVKQVLTKELGWGERWQGTIFINIHPLRFDNEWPEVTPIRTDRGWGYRLNMPDEMARRDLLETLVETLLLEFIHRGVAQPSAELPPWLVEGLTAHLSQGPLAGVALQSRSLQQIAQEPQLRAARTVKHIDVDKALREKVQTVGALSVDQLNWPEFEDNDEAAAIAYHDSAHLFVRELLKLRGGPDALCATLASLPQHLNWQTAFLRGFQPHFRRMLDVEKWWSVTLMQIKSHESSALWSSAEAQQKLEEILYTPMEVRLVKDEASHFTPVSLQTVLSDWDFQQQAPLLQTKLVQLQAARLHCLPETGALIDRYRVTLEKYFSIRSRPGRWFTERKARAAIADAVAELNALDQKRLSVSNPLPKAETVATISQ